MSETRCTTDEIRRLNILSRFLSGERLTKKELETINSQKKKPEPLFR